MFNGNGGSGDFNGNGAWAEFNGGAILDEEVEEAQDWADEDVEELLNLLNENDHNLGLPHIELDGLQQIEHNAGLQPIEPNGGLQQIDHDLDLQPMELDGGLQPQNGAQGDYNGIGESDEEVEEAQDWADEDVEELLNLLNENDNNLGLPLIEPDGLQQIEHNAGLQLIEPNGGLQPHNGAQGDFNGVGESDEEEEAAYFGEIAELEPELLEDLEPYWFVDNGEEQENLLNMDPPPDDFFDGVDNDIQRMVGGED